MIFRYAIISASLLLCACASAPRVAPRFDKPSTTAIQKANKSASVSVKHAEQIVKTLTISSPEDKAKIDALTNELTNAQDSLQQAEGSRVQLDEQLALQTAKANNLADNFDKASAQISSLEVSRHRWVKYFLIVSALLVVAGAWIFRKPILMAIGGIGI